MTTNYPLGLAAERGRAGDWRIVDNHRTVLATIHGISGYAIGLAKLWAAAPDLLSTLKTTLQEFRKCAETLADEWIGPEDSTDQAIEQAEALIAKLEAQP